MIIRETRIVECWCPSCQQGQMEDILQLSFQEKKQLHEYIGQVIKCKCGAENKIEDFVSVIPTGFLVHSKNNTSLPKVNEDVKNFLDRE